MAIKANGTKFQRGDGAATEVFTDVAEVINIEGPGFSRDVIEVSTGQNDWRMYLPGMADAGEVSLELNFDPEAASHGVATGLLKDLKEGVIRNFKLLFPNTPPTTWSFAGIVTEFTPNMPFDAQITASVTIKLNGEPVLA